MHVRRALGSLLAAVALAAPVAGCAKSAGDLAAEAHAAQRAWIDKVCGSYIPLLDLAAAPPTDTVLADPVAAHPAFRAYLRNVVGAMEQTATGLDEAGKSPIPGGDQAVSDARTSLLGARATVVRLKDTFDALPDRRVDGEPPTTSLARSVTAVLSSQNPVSTLRVASEDLRNEVDNAPNCQTLSDRSLTLSPDVSSPLDLGTHVPLPSLPPPLITRIPGS